MAQVGTAAELAASPASAFVADSPALWCSPAPPGRAPTSSPTSAWTGAAASSAVQPATGPSQSATTPGRSPRPRRHTGQRLDPEPPARRGDIRHRSRAPHSRRPRAPQTTHRGDHRRLRPPARAWPPAPAPSPSGKPPPPVCSADEPTGTGSWPHLSRCWRRRSRCWRRRMGGRAGNIHSTRAREGREARSRAYAALSAVRMGRMSWWAVDNR